VLTRASGDEAVSLVEAANQPVDLLLTDVVLPGELQGPSLAKLAVARRPELPVLYMSGYPREEIVHHARLDEGVNHIEKPFTPGQLAEKVRQVLESRSPGQSERPSCQNVP
jgi:DNA-binding NtrC family response regulator